MMRSATSKTSAMLWLISRTARPAAAQAADQLQHLPRLGHGQRRGRLVHDDEPGLELERPGDRHGLALAARERAHLGLDVRDVGVEIAQELLHLLAHRAAAQEGDAQHPAGALAAEKDVLDDREVLRQRQLLVDRGDALGRCVLWRAQRDRLALDQQLARGRLDRHQTKS